jgi:hypothetical protein
LQIGVENREGESLIENIVTEAVHDILESEELDKALDDCDKQPPSLFSKNVNS